MDQKQALYHLKRDLVIRRLDRRIYLKFIICLLSVILDCCKSSFLYKYHSKIHHGPTGQFGGRRRCGSIRQHRSSPRAKGIREPFRQRLLKYANFLIHYWRLYNANTSCSISGITNEDTSPPKLAISFTNLDEIN